MSTPRRFPKIDAGRLDPMMLYRVNIHRLRLKIIAQTAPGVLLGFLSQSHTSAADSYAPLQVNASLTLNGRALYHTWKLPGSPGSVTRPVFGTVAIRLADGEDLWININGLYNPIRLNNEAGAAITTHSKRFYFVNTVSSPQTLLDYSFAFQGGYCPAAFRIAGCDITITTSRLPDQQLL